MKNNIDRKSSDGRKIFRRVAKTDTHEIKLVFLCKISKKEEQMIAVNEAEKIVASTNGNILKLADDLASVRTRFRDLGCVGYQIEKR